MNESTPRPWLSAIPRTWAVQRIKHVVRFAGGGTPSKAVDDYWGGDIPWVSPKDMKTFRITESQDNITEAAVASSACSLIPVGATLMVVRSGILQHTIPVAINDVPVCLNQDMKALIPEEGMVSEYLAYLIQGLNDRLLDEWVKQGATVESIEHESMANTPIPVPPFEQQLDIVSYLDAETARIDGLIEQKTTLLALVDEMHQSRVTEILQKGVRPDRATYPTGDRRISRIPEGWSLVRWKHVGRFKAGAGFPVDLQGQVGKPYPFFKVKDISLADERGVMSNADSTVDDADASRLGAAVLPADTIVFAKVGAALLLSRFRILACPGCIDNNMMGFTVDTDMALPRYVLHAMAQFDLGDLANPGTVPSLNERQVRDLPIAMPPLDEQVEIAGELDRLADDAHEMRKHVTKEIELLKELRSATIADAVLGRIDVRKHMKH